MHSRLSPSSAERWYACPGSLALCDLVPDISTKYADEGTRAHEVAAKALNDSTYVIPDEFSAVTEYVQYCNLLMQDNCNFWIEQRFESVLVSGLGGTPDFACHYIEDDRNVIEIVDYKHGQGVSVGGKTKQLECYCFLVWESLQFRPSIRLKPFLFRITIIQPRRHQKPWHDEFEIDKLKWVIDYEESPDLQMGQHCQFCKAANICPLTHTRIRTLLEDPTMLSLREILNSEIAIKAAIKQARLQAQHTIEQGGEVPGYKLIKSYGNTRWRDGDEQTIKLLRNRGIGKRDSTTPKILSPTALKKKFPDKKAAIEKLSFRPLNGTKLVPESAAGDPVEFSSPSDDFTEIPSDITPNGGPSNG